jgi:pyruvate dehydrogenase E2 component (dihydrolipoamide acetyltransferase)
MFEYKMPKVDHTSEEGAVVEWFVKEGDIVRRGDMIMTMEANKAVLEIEANFDGRIRQILLEPGESVPVLTAIALVDEV